MKFSDLDRQHMKSALQLAERGLYTTMPNPRVGCVIVKDAVVVGQGWHERAGGPHAEVVALREAGARAAGADVYVSLEPCAHFGRTPPCCDALIAAGVRRVVAATQDVDPRTAGGGLAKLRAAGIEVAHGLMQAEARALNAGFFARLTRGRPWVRLKVAASLDGRTALANGMSQWITGEAARADAHAWRARSCAVMTGVGTLLDDDPQLTARAVATPRQPLKVLVDSRLQAPLTAKLFAGGTVLVFAAADDADKIGALRSRGVEVALMSDERGKVDLQRMMRELAQRQVNEVLVESGSKLNGSLLRAGVVDELLIYLAPALLGDQARGMFSLPALASLSEQIALEITDVTQIGVDLRLLARVKN